MMALPETFAKLSDQRLELSPPSQRLYPLSAAEVQFRSFGSEFLACADLTPYGDRTPEAANGTGPSPDLLPVAQKFDDYTLFELPVDLLSLDRITLGQGVSEIPALLPVYRNAGSLIRKYSAAYKMRQVGVKSLALLRNSGQFVFIPPYHFEAGTDDPALVINDFTQSIQKLLRRGLYAKKIARLVRSSEVGFNHASV